MNITDLIKKSVSDQEADVFLRSDFLKFGSPAQVGRALVELQRRGVLVKLGLGVYAKAKPSVLSGAPIPIRPLEVLAEEVFRRLGVVVEGSRQTLEYNFGLSTQVPAGIVLNTGKRRIQRKLGFNGKFVQYERPEKRSVV